MQGLTLRQQITHLATNMIAAGKSFTEGQEIVEREWLVLALLAAKGNIKQAAADLGIPYRTLSRKMKHHHIPSYVMRSIRLREAAALRIERRKVQSISLAAGGQ